MALPLEKAIATMIAKAEARRLQRFMMISQVICGPVKLAQPEQNCKSHKIAGQNCAFVASCRLCRGFH
jgi:hypothetical protein